MLSDLAMDLTESDLFRPDTVTFTSRSIPDMWNREGLEHHQWLFQAHSSFALSGLEACDIYRLVSAWSQYFDDSRISNCGTNSNWKSELVPDSRSESTLGVKSAN